MWLGIALYISMLLFFVFEYVFPYKKNWLTSKKQFIQFPFFLICSFFLVHFIQETLYNIKSHETLLTNLPFIPALLLAFIIGEFFYYWFHRLEHSSKFFWNIHSVHHNQKSVNFVNFWFAHPVEMALNFLISNVPLILLGFKMEVLGVYLVMVSFLYMFSHSNINIKLGYLKYIIGNPELHRFHHSISPLEAKNYCGRLPLWDIVFGTFHYKPGEFPEQVGIIDEESYPKDILPQLYFPIREFIKDTKRKWKAQTN